MKNRLLLHGIALLSVIPPVLAAQIAVGPNVQVSAAHAGDTHYEVLVAADPTNPKHLIVGSFYYPDDNTENGSMVYASFDGGVTWQPTLAGEELLHTSDPAVAYGPGGVAYYVAAVLPEEGQRTMRLFRSPDGGRSWEPPSTFTYTDREYITVDHTGGKHHGRIYVNGNNRIPRGVSDIVMFYSTDEGRTFHGPGKREGFGKFTVDNMGNAVVTSDGTVVALIGEAGREKQHVLRSTTSVDGGISFTPAVTIDRFVVGGNRKGAQNNVNAQPMLAIDPGSASWRDRLYAVWPDRRAGRSQIFFAWFADKGATWSASRAINDNAPDDATDQLMPNVAVNRDGVVAVMWYDRRNHPDNLGWDVRMAASLDGGENFLPSVEVSEEGTRFDASQRWTALRPWTQRSAPSKGKEGVQTLQVSLNTFMFMGGDTAGFAAGADGVFHPVWVDSRTGTPQIWTAAVSVHRQVPERASFAEARDLSGQLTVELSQPRFDQVAGTLTVVARLANVSGDALRGPFRVQVKSLDSDFGRMTVDDAVDGWVFSAGELATGAMSDPQLVRFRLSDRKPFRGEKRYQLGLLKLSFTVQGAGR